MADKLCTTRRGADETAYFKHSPTSGHFSHFVAALGVAIEAERDIEHGLWSDPAFDHWLAEAEAAWQTATDLCRAAFEAPATRHSDVPLQRFARHLHWTIGCETQAELSTARQIIAGHPHLFRWRGHDPEARRISQLLARARQQFDELCDLDMLNGLEAPSDVTVDQAEPAPELFAA
ncbi:hypothetical protein [Pseudodonghicola xiamenensis]|uniref:Uncharacterized protein n=1 Tax=Pseudodonghicola xiamenensis TaxID=337702 RepID=A0A8J3HD52_9RHOB|nr:hypothetical protein [Pseudodonghicola xiamenensis]GHH05734.1 hypothetical protein GCM10010961_44700 [Pseudodonghicola xiamenensis]